MSGEKIVPGKLPVGLFPNERDAIHVAIFCAVAGQNLYPGQKVRIEGGLAVGAGPGETSLGVVDPFLPRTITEDELFYLFVNPGTTTGMKHSWEHPTFDRLVTGGVLEATDFLLEFIEHTPITSLEELGVILKKAVVTEQYYTENGSESLRNKITKATPKVFWKHVSTYFGIDQPHGREEYSDYFPFSCSC